MEMLRYLFMYLQGFVVGRVRMGEGCQGYRS